MGALLGTLRTWPPPHGLWTRLGHPHLLTRTSPHENLPDSRHNHERTANRTDSIFSYLTERELATARAICRKWGRIIAQHESYVGASSIERLSVITHARDRRVYTRRPKIHRISLCPTKKRTVVYLWWDGKSHFTFLLNEFDIDTIKKYAALLCYIAPHKVILEPVTDMPNLQRLSKNN